MRIFDPDKGTITRTYVAPNGNGSEASTRAVQMERKVMAAAMDLLKDDDEALGQMISATLGEAVKKISTMIAASEKAHAGSMSDVRSAVAAAAKAPEAPLKEIRAEIKEANSGHGERHKEIMALIEATADSIVAALKTEPPPPPPAPKPVNLSFKVVERDASGKIKEVRATEA